MYQAIFKVPTLFLNNLLLVIDSLHDQNLGEMNSSELQTHYLFYWLKAESLLARSDQGQIYYRKLLSLPCDNDFLSFWCITQLLDAGGIGRKPEEIIHSR